MKRSHSDPRPVPLWWKIATVVIVAATFVAMGWRAAHAWEWPWKYLWPDPTPAAMLRPCEVDPDSDECKAGFDVHARRAWIDAAGTLFVEDPAKDRTWVFPILTSELPRLIQPAMNYDEIPYGLDQGQLVVKRGHLVK